MKSLIIFASVLLLIQQCFCNGDNLLQKDIISFKISRSIDNRLVDNDSTFKTNIPFDSLSSSIPKNIISNFNFKNHKLTSKSSVNVHLTISFHDTTLSSSSNIQLCQLLEPSFNENINLYFSDSVPLIVDYQTTTKFITKCEDEILKLQNNSSDAEIQILSSFLIKHIQKSNEIITKIDTITPEEVANDDINELSSQKKASDSANKKQLEDDNGIESKGPSVEEVPKNILERVTHYVHNNWIMVLITIMLLLFAGGNDPEQEKKKNNNDSKADDTPKSNKKRDNE